MTRTFIGRKTSGGGGALKCMRNDADDPNTTPNTDVGKFKFNSETQNIGYISKILTAGPFTWDPSGAYTYYGGGGTLSTCHYAVANEFGIQYVYMFPHRIIGSSFVPLVEVRFPAPLGTVRNGPRMIWNRTEIEPGFAPPREVGYYDGRTAHFSDTSPYVVSDFDAGSLGDTAVEIRLGNGGSALVTIFELPFLSPTALSYPSASPVAGQCNVRINPSGAWVTRPGFDVGSASGDQFIINSNRVPAKIIRAGEVTLGSGASTFLTTPVALTANCYLDYMVWRAGEAASTPVMMVSGLSQDRIVGLSYYLQSNGVSITNNGNESITVRYMICADDDDLSASSGGTHVLFKGNDGTQDYIQLKKPGSSDTAPKLNEILFDSRFAYLPIIAEGYLTSFGSPSSGVAYGDASAVVTFSNPAGFLPFPKFTTLLTGTSQHLARGPVSKQFGVYGVASSFNGTQSRDGTVAVVTSTSVTFNTCLGNASILLLDGSGQPEAIFQEPHPYGIRYYIFGIPNAL